jgi:hypothetical protein
LHLQKFQTNKGDVLDYEPFLTETKVIMELATTMKPPTPKPSLRMMNMFKLLQPADASRILPRTVMFLPPREIISKAAFTDPELLDGAFNHPVVVIPRPESTKHDSRIEFVVVSQKI